MSGHPPAAIALGDQMHARMLNDALTAAREAIDRENLHPSEEDLIYVEIGVGAGILAAMRVLADMGILKVNR